MTDAKEVERIVSQSRASRRAATVCMADVEPEEVRWLWFPYIPLGKITLLEGDPGLGKTFLALQIASIVTRGDPFPEEDDAPSVAREPSSVVYLSAEDGLADTLRPRLDSAGADAGRVHALTGVLVDSDSGQREVPLTLSDVDALQDAIRRTCPTLVVVDPMQAYLGADVDMHRANETRPVLAGLSRVAEANGCAILIIRHLTKGHQKAMYRGQGSIDIAAAARSGLLVGEHPRNPHQRVVAHFKASLAVVGPSLAFEIGEHGLVWAGRVDVTADELGAPPVSEEERDKLSRAREFLAQLLADGEVAQRTVREEAKSAGVAMRTVERAKKDMGVKSYRRSDGNTGKGEWVWARPTSPEDKPSPNTPMTPLRTDEEKSSGTSSPQSRLGPPLAALPGVPPARSELVLPQDRPERTRGLDDPRAAQEGPEPQAAPELPTTSSYVEDREER